MNQATNDNNANTLTLQRPETETTGRLLPPFRGQESFWVEVNRRIRENAPVLDTARERLF
ncbi:MAG: hypothetical protein JO102_04400 [Elusimicrobia bacterium]|nr:hypothetical protein [Elusimicrobiota bacterium]